MKQGKKPLSQKPKAVFIQEDELFGNPLSVDPALQSDMASKNLEARWVDYKQMVEMGGFHKRGWKVYKKDPSVTLSTSEFLSGSSPDGLVRRGTLVLAVRPIETGNKHRAVLKQRADIYKGKTRQDADEMRKQAREADLDVKVHEGYEDEN